MTAKTFTETPLIQWLPDEKRLRMRHGPIDLVIEAVGKPFEVEQAYQQAARRFRLVLEELSAELGILRQALKAKPSYNASQKQTHSVSSLQTSNGVAGPIARHMHQTATRLNNTQFITPMICVAGAVADHILASLLNGRELEKAYVNNGGDIALYLATGQHFDVGVCANPLSGSLTSHAHITTSSDIAGIATSGWRGRSHSLGIADAVTVLACDAATADTAATLIANAIDLPGHTTIERTRANELMPDSDLGGQLVTTDVGKLSEADIELALASGKKLAQSMIDKGDVVAVYANLQSEIFSLSDNFFTDMLSNTDVSLALQSGKGHAPDAQTTSKNYTIKEMIHA